MKTSLLTRFSLLGVLILAGLLGVDSIAAAAESGYSVVLKTETRQLEILLRGQRLLVYAFATNQFKPYVRELYTLDGVNVLRDAPADHLHHHALMYAIKVNDINFWEEPRGAGHQKPLNQLTRDVKKDPQGRTQASFSQMIHWVPEEQATLADTTPAALLVEQRTITRTARRRSPTRRRAARRRSADYRRSERSLESSQHCAHAGIGVARPA